MTYLMLYISSLPVQYFNSAGVSLLLACHLIALGSSILPGCPSCEYQKFLPSTLFSVLWVHTGKHQICQKHFTVNGFIHELGNPSHDHNFMELLFRSGSLTNGFLQVFLFETVFMVFCKQQELYLPQDHMALVYLFWQCW
jgi:hypothetical protein